MTAQGEDVLAWLDSAVSAVEDIARATTDRQPNDEWDAVGAGDEDDAARSHWEVVGIATMKPTPAASDLAQHIALHDPASVLRRCAADRMLIYEVRRTAQNAKDRPWDPMYGPYAEAMLAAAKVVAEGYGWTEGQR